MWLDRSNEHGVQRSVQLRSAQSIDERASTRDQRAVLSSVRAGQVGAHLANLSHARPLLDLEDEGYASSGSLSAPPVGTGTDAVPGGVIEIVRPSISNTISGCPDELVMPTGFVDFR